MAQEMIQVEGVGQMTPEAVARVIGQQAHEWSKRHNHHLWSVSLAAFNALMPAGYTLTVGSDAKTGDPRIAVACPVEDEKPEPDAPKQEV